MSRTEGAVVVVAAEEGTPSTPRPTTTTPPHPNHPPPHSSICPITRTGGVHSSSTRSPSEPPTRHWAHYKVKLKTLCILQEYVLKDILLSLKDFHTARNQVSFYSWRHWECCNNSIRCLIDSQRLSRRSSEDNSWRHWPYCKNLNGNKWASLVEDIGHNPSEPPSCWHTKRTQVSLKDIKYTARSPSKDRQNGASSVGDIVYLSPRARIYLNGTKWAWRGQSDYQRHWTNWVKLPVCLESNLTSISGFFDRDLDGPSKRRSPISMLNRKWVCFRTDCLGFILIVIVFFQSLYKFVNGPIFISLKVSNDSSYVETILHKCFCQLREVLCT